MMYASAILPDTVNLLWRDDVSSGQLMQNASLKKLHQHRENLIGKGLNATDALQQPSLPINRLSGLN